MQKRQVKLLSAMVLLVMLALLAVPGAAMAEDGIAPYLTYIEDAEVTMNITETTATVDAWVKGDWIYATKAKIIAELQVKNGSNWIPVAIWTDTQDGFKAHVYETKSVVKGHTYRVKATGTIWEGSQSETVTFYTDEDVA